jgi:hypothetical protein
MLRITQRPATQFALPSLTGPRSRRSRRSRPRRGGRTDLTVAPPPLARPSSHLQYSLAVRRQNVTSFFAPIDAPRLALARDTGLPESPKHRPRAANIRSLPNLLH